MPQNDKTRSRYLGAKGKIHLAKPLTDLDMIARNKGKGGNRAMRAHKLIVILVIASWHGVIEQVRQFHQPAVQLGGENAFLAFNLRHLLLDVIDFGDQRIGILTL